MSNKEIQEKRVKSYFIDAAKEIISAEGIKAASARTIAERAGYSYATIYNYFDDITGLHFLAIKEFMNDCFDFVSNNINDKSIFELSKEYTNYFIQYPSIFSILYLEGFDSSNETDFSEINNFFDMLAEKICSIDINSSGFKSYKYELHGLLLFNLGRQNKPDYKKIIDSVGKIMFS